MIATTFGPLVLLVLSSFSLVSFDSVATAEPVKDELVATMISKINETEIYNSVYTLQNFTTRRNGTPGNEETRTYLYDRLNNIPGLDVGYQGGYQGGPYNVIGTLNGTDPESNVIFIVGGHYDSKVDSQDTSYPAPGATDNGGGVAIVLELARIMSQYEFSHTIKFAFFNAEEDGTIGSNWFADACYGHGLNISLFFNFDASCYDPENRFILDIMSNNQSQWVSDMMTEHNILYEIGFTLTYNVHHCTSDHVPFWYKGFTAVATHQETHGDFVHTADDTIDKVSTQYARKNGQLGMSVLATLAGVVAGPTPEPTPSPSPEPTPTLSPSPEPTPTLSPSPEPTPTPTTAPTPAPTPAASPSSSPSVSPTPQPTSTPEHTMSLFLPIEAVFGIGVIVIVAIVIIFIVLRKRK